MAMRELGRIRGVGKGILGRVVGQILVAGTGPDEA
jgi:hypothetical protein